MTKKKLIAAGNTVVPALLTLEQLGFTITMEASSDQCIAVRGEETFVADDPVTVLGLVKLVEKRSWNWRPSDEEIDQVLIKYRLG